MAAKDLGKSKDVYIEKVDAVSKRNARLNSLLTSMEVSCTPTSNK